jgi:hypothetical protein
MKKYFIIFSLLLQFTNLESQQFFNKTYYDTLNSKNSFMSSISIIETIDNGFVICGSGKNNGIFSALKVNYKGDTLWTFTSDLGGPNVLEWFWDVVETRDSNYVLVGTTGDSVLQHSQAVVFKLKKESGDTIFVKKIGLPFSNEIFISVEETLDHGLIASGKRVTEISIIKEQVDSYVVKMDENGNVEWENIYTTPNGSGVSDIIETPEGDFLMVGGYTTSSSIHMDVCYQKINRFGELLWRKVFETFEFNLPYRICRLKNGNYAVTGIISQVFGPDEYSGFVQVINPNGDLIWEKEYKSNSKYLYYKSIDELENGNLAVCGYEYYQKNTNSPSNEMFIRKFGVLRVLDPNNGEIILDKKVQFFDQDTTFHDLAELLVCKDGGLVMTGRVFDYRSSTISSNPRYSMWIVKTDCEGNDTFWDYNHCGHAENADLELSIFPNPSTGELTFYGVNENIAELTIFNALGAEIYHSTPLNKFETVNLISQAAGIYTCRVRTESNQLIVRKIARM